MYNTTGMSHNKKYKCKIKNEELGKRRKRTFFEMYPFQYLFIP